MTTDSTTTTPEPVGAGMGDEPPLPPLGTTGLLRWLWRQLTSMRTALILLFLLALASVPGSVLPQRGANPQRVSEWITNNPTMGPILDRLGFFDVFASPWFAAVYLLLFISLIGCVLPRIGQHWKAMRTPPPAAPRRLLRLPAATEFASEDSADAALASAQAWLRSHRWRVRRGETDGTPWLAAETGYLRETGNLVFHLSLIIILVAVAVGGLFGWKGNVIVREGTGFSNTLTQYDAWGGGRMVDPAQLAPFSFTLDDFKVDFERGEAQRGAPRLFEADVTYRPTPGAPAQPTTIEVNHPLDVDGARVFLIGHGYALHFIVRDSTGNVVYDDTSVFLPRDSNLTSNGVVKVPDSDPPLGFNGLFLPTAAMDATRGGFSTFPALDNPEVLLAAFRGDLGLDSGVPQSVYTLDTSRMNKIGLEAMRPGDIWQLPNDSGSIEFAGVDRWASLQIAYDPGKELALLAAVIAISGLTLSLFIRRRRIWVKVLDGPEGGTLVQIAALAKAEGADPSDDVSALAEHLGGTAATERSEP
ncbi:MAG: cytochrome c biogenesis protein ResB [Actinomycetales bacterium]|nr:cytochrome c biogenesis protein ResB [Actinomycetales bacterium]